MLLYIRYGKPDKIKELILLLFDEKISFSENSIKIRLLKMMVIH